MKILFTLLNIPNHISEAGMYGDMVLKFKEEGHEVTVIGGTQRGTKLHYDSGVRVLQVKSLPILYVKNLIHKGIGMATLPFLIKLAYKKYFNKEKYDWIVMPTPPITLVDVVKYIKEKSGARLYMILRDIHPQSSASLGEIKYRWMIKYLYKRADEGYRISDIVGCMSPANIEYVHQEHKIREVSKFKVLYNWMTFVPYVKEDCEDIRKKYNLSGMFIVIFGGNIGLGQCVENIVDLANHYKNDKNIKFVIIGKGVKKNDLVKMAEALKLKNILFFDYMPRGEYMSFIKSADLGLISINSNNAAPTCPSKILSYMSLKIPVLALINSNSDYGKVYIEQANAGFWSVASDKIKVYSLFDRLYKNKELRNRMGEDGYNFYCRYLTTEKVYCEMIKQMKE